jgi:hypothetical protein
MVYLLIALVLISAGEQPTKITPIATKQGVPNTPDSIGETDVHNQDVVTCTIADDENGPGKGVCYLNLPSGRSTLNFRKSVSMDGTGHLKLTCGEKGERHCQIIVIQGFPRPPK